MPHVLRPRIARTRRRSRRKRGLNQCSLKVFGRPASAPGGASANHDSSLWFDSLGRTSVRKSSASLHSITTQIDRTWSSIGKTLARLAPAHSLSDELRSSPVFCYSRQSSPPAARLLACSAAGRRRPESALRPRLARARCAVHARGPQARARQKPSRVASLPPRCRSLNLLSTLVVPFRAPR